MGIDRLKYYWSSYIGLITSHPKTAAVVIAVLLAAGLFFMVK